MSAVRFTTHASDDKHAARCTAGICPFRCDERGPNATRNVRRQAVEHVDATGHEVRITITSEHGYRPRRD